MSPFEEKLVAQSPTPLPPLPSVELPAPIAPKASPWLVGAATILGALTPVAVILPFPPWNAIAAVILGAASGFCGAVSTGKFDPSALLTGVAALASAFKKEPEVKP